MLPRQPLRFLLADDPGAGKTIMAGLYIKELIIRGDLERCLIVAPGQPRRAVAGRAVARSSGSSFEILTRDTIEASRTRQPVRENDRCSSPASTSWPATRTLQAKLEASRTGTWSSSTRPTRCRPTTSAARSKETKRYQLGRAARRASPGTCC